MGYFKWKLKKAVLSVESVFVFTVVLCCYIFAGMSVINFDGDFLSDFIGIASNSLPALIFPMVVCIPVALNYVTEYESGCLNLLLSKMPLWRYIAIKLFTNAVVSGLVLSLPAVIYLLRILIKKGFAVDSYIESSWPIVLYPHLYETHPFVYVSIIIGFIFLCGMVFATLGLGIAAVMKKKYLVILIPQAYYVGAAAIVQNMNLCRYLDPMTLYVLNSPVPLKLSIRLLYALVIFIVGAVMFVLGVRKNVE